MTPGRERGQHGQQFVARAAQVQGFLKPVDASEESHRPLLLDGLDPSLARTVTEFATYVDRLRVRAELSYDQLTHKIVNIPDAPSMGKTTIWELLKGKRPFRQNELLAVMRAFGLEERYHETWVKAWLKVTEQHHIPELGEPHPLQSQIARLEDEVAEKDREIEELNDREQQLRQEVVAEVERRNDIERELERVRAQLNLEHARADELQRQLTKWEEERGRIDDRIVGLRVDLALTRRDLEHAEDERDRLLAEKSDLKSVSVTVEDLLILHFERAENERRNREQLEQTNRDLEKRITELVQLLAEYQASHRDIEPPREVEQLTSGNNEDAVLKATFADDDFGRQHTQPFTFPWYCTACDRGGRLYHPHCPHCEKADGVVRNYAKQIRFNLPNSPRYGKVLVLHEQGYHDEPRASPGNIQIWISRKSS